MILGIGVDLCSISRIERAIESEHFVKRIFSPEEVEYANRKSKRRSESFAASFAAREAFCKASGMSLDRVMFGGNFSLSHNANGKPEIILSGEMKSKISDTKIFVSITHEENFACAMVVIEKI